MVNGTEAHYYVNDHLGTTELVTDERGRLTENISHTPFSERIKVLAYSYWEQRLSETDWLDLTNTTARIENGQAGPAKVPVEVEELLHQDDTRVLVEDPHYTPAKEYIYRHDDPDVLELKVTSGFKDPETGGYVEYVDLFDLSAKPLGDYRIVLETRKDVGQAGPTENLKFEVYVSKRLRPVESVLRTKPISLGDAIAFSFTPQGTGLEDIVWSISRDNGQTWVEVQAGTLLPADGASEILLKADLKVVEGHEPPVVTGIDWVFVAERETSERYTFTGKARDASGLYYFGGRYYDPEVGRWTAVDPAGDGLNWYAYSDNNPLRFIDTNGLWKKDATNWVAEKGDTLWSLAEIIYGNGAKWERLGYNGDPMKLQIGTKIPDPIDSTLQANCEWASKNRNPLGFIIWIIKVAPHSEWDYKNNPDWSGTTYNWNRLKLTAEDLGNLNYGLTGAALGLSKEVVLLGAAGANLAYGSIKSPIDSPSLGDDPRDIFFVHFGYEYYDVLMGNREFWDAFVRAYYQVY